MLTYAIQDEYLAYEEYAYILEIFGNQKPFSNIIKAEEKHIELLKPLFAEYDFPVPANTADDHLVYPDNVKSALEAGVQAEIDNIAIYEAFLKENLPEDVRAVFEELRNASENHLAAFLNVSRPSMSRELCKMRDEGIIDFRLNSFRILDCETLKAMNAF